MMRHGQCDRLDAGGWATRLSSLLGFRVQGIGFRVQGLGFRVQGLGFRVQGLGFRVAFLGLRFASAEFSISRDGCRPSASLIRY